MEKRHGWLFWAPRILLIVFALFLMIFSLDIFDDASSAGEIAIGLFMHNLPSLFLFVLLWLSWKHDLAGAVVFMVLGAVCVVGAIASLASVMAISGQFNPLFLIGSVVFLSIGFLFLAGARR